jgi:hypothetical protein
MYALLNNYLFQVRFRVSVLHNTGLNFLFCNRYMFRSYDHLPLQDGHKTETSVALDGNPEPDLVHATGCKQPTLRFKIIYFFKFRI